MRLKRVIYIIIGSIGVGLGAIGAIFPMIPSVPFLLLAAYCFARSSKRINDWFVNTKLYKNNLESYVQGKGMTRMTKIKIMITVTILMTIGFIMMDAVPIGRIVLGCIWGCHILYFSIGVKTLNN